MTFNAVFMVAAINGCPIAVNRFLVQIRRHGVCVSNIFLTPFSAVICISKHFSELIPINDERRIEITG